MKFVEVHTPNLKYDVDKALQSTLDLVSKDNENLLPSHRELLKWYFRLIHIFFTMSSGWPDSTI